MTFTVTRGLGDVRSRPHPVVTIGNFDGHHRGHHSLLQTVVERARAVQGTAMVLTFDPHPVRVLAPHVELRFLTSPEEKLARFKAAGIDEVVFLEFTPALAAMTPEEFADIVLHRRLQYRGHLCRRTFCLRTGTRRPNCGFGTIWRLAGDSQSIPSSPSC